MTREEAQARAAELGREDPDKVFAARRRSDGAWEVVGVAVPVTDRSGLHAETRAGPDVRPDPSEGRHPPIHGARGY
jgi:hypothetical protein